MAFTQPVDIYGRACQRLGVRRPISATDNSVEAVEMNFVYDKLRQAELERNLWRYATKRGLLRAIGVDTVIWTPQTWQTAYNYPAGSVVSYTPTSGSYSGVTTYWWTATGILASTTTPDQDPQWKHYTGSTVLDLYNTGTYGLGSTSVPTNGLTYSSGEVVLVPATWSSETTYSVNQVLARENASNQWAWYVSLTNSNLNNDPLTSTTNWQLWTSNGRGNNLYGDTATRSPIPLSYPGAFSVYMSLYNNNADNPLAGTNNWISLGGTISPLVIAWPLGAGPAHDTSTKNVFRLPNAFLKQAPTDPKGAQQPYLGAYSGVSPEDWTFEDEYIVSGDAGPLMMRFVADITDVPSMSNLFCEMLSAAMAVATADRLTQDKMRKQMAERDYDRDAAKARTTNAIEIGPISPVENRLVTVRA